VRQNKYVYLAMSRQREIAMFATDTKIVAARWHFVILFFAHKKRPSKPKCRKNYAILWHKDEKTLKFRPIKKAQSHMNIPFMALFHIINFVEKSVP
jgi:hypothetical protein